MSIIHSTKPCPFNFTPWLLKNIDRLYAGHGCVMAITAKGEVLQQVSDGSLAADTDQWKHIKSISISRIFSALAVGLTEEGTCVVSQNALKHACACTGVSVGETKEAIQSLKNIVEVLVSDAVFALDSFGKVHHVPLSKTDAYKEVDAWQDIRHLAAGNQDSVLGITKSGNVLCAGANLSHAKEKLESLQGVLDICAMGSECEQITVALADERTVDWDGKDLQISHSGKWPVFSSGCLFTAVSLKDGRVKCLPYNYMEGVERIEKAPIHSLAIGTDENYFPAFAVWN